MREEHRKLSEEHHKDTLCMGARQDAYTPFFQGTVIQVQTDIQHDTRFPQVVKDVSWRIRVPAQFGVGRRRGVDEVVDDNAVFFDLCQSCIFTELVYPHRQNVHPRQLLDDVRIL